MRGLFNFRGALYAVRGDTLLKINKNGDTTNLATLNSQGGLVTFDENLTQMQICDGSYLYVWDGTTLQTAPNFVPGGRIAVVNERTVNIQRQSQRYSWSAPGNALSHSALDFKSAESTPDVLVDLLAVNSDLWLFGVNGTEIHANVATSAVFERYDGATLEFGCTATHTAQKSGGKPTWLATNGRRGQGVVVQAQGQSAKVVSDRSTEERIAGKNLGGAKAFTFALGKDEFYALNVPGVSVTLVYNSTTGQWNDCVELVNGQYQQWRPWCHAFVYGRNYFGDKNGRLYYADADTHTFAGDPLCRVRVCPNMGQQQGRRAHYGSAQLVCERATGGVAMLRWKDDPQDGWGGWRRASTGAKGKYRSEIRWNQLGSAEGLNGRIFELRMTDDAPFNPVIMEFGVK
jgi:hypothetical protein